MVEFWLLSSVTYFFFTLASKIKEVVRFWLDPIQIWLYPLMATITEQHTGYGLYSYA